MTATIAEPCTLQGEILESARQVVQSGRFTVSLEDEPWAGAGIKNRPLLILLDCLVSTTGSLANAIADNAIDDSLPVPLEGARRLAEALHRIGDVITAAASAPDPAVTSIHLPTGWSLPSSTGKELV